LRKNYFIFFLRFVFGIKMQYNFDELIDRNHTDSVKYGLRKLVFGTEDVIPLWVADMDFRSPDFIVEAVRQRAAHEIYGYPKLPENYSDPIVSWAEKRYQWKIEKQWITDCPGVVPSLAVSILAFTNPGDKVIIQTPVYPPFFSVVQENDRVIVLNQLMIRSGKYSIDFDDLEKKAAQGAKMMILCNPHNPVGRVWGKNELLELAKLCLKHGVLIVSDEIHSDIIFKPWEFVPISSLSEEIANNTISCLAPSKSFNIAGLSASYTVISNQELRKNFKRQLAALHLHHGSYFGPIALEAAYLYGEDWLDQMLVYISNNIEIIEQYLIKNLPEIKMVKPEGTYLVWLDCRELNMDDRELKQFMIHGAGLGLNDGPTFGPGGSGYQRMNIACPAAVLKVALDKLNKAVQVWRGQTANG
jgi:cysteine-S-conjugate beta-lyase